MKRLLILFTLVVLPLALLAQTQSISGVVLDESTHQPLIGANVFLEGTRWGTTTDEDGVFILKNLPAGEYVLVVEFLGYQTYRSTLSVQPGGTYRVEIFLKPVALPGEEVLVQSIQAVERKTPVVFTNLDESYIREVHTVEDIPMMLTEIPNVYAYSDAGNGTGYSYLKVRGFDQKRIGVMINGIPLNDPEDHQVYWVDMPDFAESLEEIQFQRGVGSSLYGISAFGGSLNMRTSTFTDLQAPEAYVNAGSYNTRRYGLKFTIPLVANRYYAHVRFSRILSDGFRERSGTRQWAVYTSLARVTRKSFTQLNIYGGEEIVHAAWEASPESALKQNHRHNPITYPNTIDNFKQPHIELHNVYQLSSNSYLKNTLFYIHGIGYYETYKSRRNLWQFGLWPDPQTAPRSDLIRQKWVGKNQTGWISQYSLNHKQGEFTIGTYLSYFNSHHWGEVEWLQNEDLLTRRFTPGFRYYEYFGQKYYLTGFANELYRLTPRINLMLNLHYQWIRYTFEQGEIANFRGQYRNRFTVDYSFFNPRFGINVNVNDAVNTYLNISVAHREPADNELFNLWEGPDDLGVQPLFKTSRPVYRNGQIAYIEWKDPLVKPEQLIDYELGVNYLRPTTRIRLNFFWMAFRNEIVPYSQVNDEGFPVRGNAESTVHRGVELSLTQALPLNLQFSGNLAYNQNKFVKFIQYDYNWDTGEITTTDFSGNTIAGFPDVLANARLTYQNGGLRASVHYQYVGKQYLDNTNRNDRIIPAFSVTNVQFSYQLGTIAGLHNLEILFRVNNVFNKKYYTAGYYDAWAGENYYWPAATRNWIAGLRFQL